MQEYILDKIAPGDALDPGPVNVLFRELLRRGSVKVGDNMVVRKGAGGMILDVEEPDAIDVLLSGATSPYSWAEQAGTVGGGWTPKTGGRSGTTDAYEYNSVAGLGGKYVQIIEDDTGTFRFTFNRVGAGGCSGSIVVRVWGCCETQAPGTNGLSGLTVTIKQGGTTLATGTTDSTGTYTYTLTTTGSYEVDVAASTYYPAATRTITAGCFKNSVNIFLNPSAGGVCCCACGLDGSVVPTTLTLHDPWGDISLAYQGVMSIPVVCNATSPAVQGVSWWSGCRDASVTVGCQGFFTPPGSPTTCTTGPGGTINVPIPYNLYCYFGNDVNAIETVGFHWTLEIGSIPVCFAPGQICPISKLCSDPFPFNAPATGPRCFPRASKSCHPTCLVFDSVDPIDPTIIAPYTVTVRDPSLLVGQCPTSVSTCTVHVTGCAGLDLPDATCTFTGPGTTTSCVTDGTGHCTVNLDATGSWTLVVTASRFNSNTQSVTIATGANTASAAMVVASGYVCWYGCAYPGPTTTLQLTDGNTGTGAAITLTYNALGPYYEGCYTTPHAVSGATVIRSGLPCSAQPVFSNIYYRFDPIATGNNPGVLTAIFPACDNSAFPPQGAASCPRPGTGWPIEQSATATSTTETCPLNMATHWQGTMELPPASNTGYHGVLLNGTVNITE